ncbi:MAG: pyridoxal-phosphate dependent enzyme, partial [Planctomycetes bacterium]|nr:pyridoxal-phosphate dependent enzyme [Planctomycetota bacterium]
AQAVPCTSKISGLQVPTVIDGNQVIDLCRINGGTGHVVTDQLVWETQQRLALEEGVFAEPAASTALAGIVRAASEGQLNPDANIACLITGSAFKDPPSLDAMISRSSAPMIELADLERRVADET